MCLRKIYTLLLLNGESYRCLFDLIGVWFMQIFCLCCTSAQLFYPLFKENIEICNYYCFNYFSTQCFHFLFCVFRGSVIRYIHVYNVTCPLTAIFIKGSSLSLTIVLYFCLIWQRRVEHSAFFMASIRTAYFPVLLLSNSLYFLISVELLSLHLVFPPSSAAYILTE